MTQILGEGSLSDGTKYILLKKEDWEGLESFRTLFEFLKDHSPNGYRETLKDFAEALGDEFPEEYQHLIKRDPMAAKFFKDFSNKKGRPPALTASQKRFIEDNKDMTGREIYEHLRATEGYRGSLKTVQNEKAKTRDFVNLF